MEKLEKIIFVADFMEPLRDKASGLEYIRKKAFLDLDEAIVLILEGTLSYLKNKGGLIDQTTEETLNYYKNKKLNA